MSQCFATLTNSEVLLLIQDIILLATGVIIWAYTKETQKMREQMVVQNTTLAEQLRLMRAAAANQDRKERSLLEPLLKQGGGDGTQQYHNFNFINQGGLIRELEVTVENSHLQPHITPKHVLATGDKGILSLRRRGDRFSDDFPAQGNFVLSYKNSIGEKVSKKFEFRTNENLLVEKEDK